MNIAGSKTGIALLLCLAYTCSMAQQPQKVTRLRITTAEFLGNYREYVITDSMIRVEKQTLNEDTVFVRSITMAERNKLLAPLDRMFLSALKEEYQPLSTNTDMPHYTFTIVKGSFVKKINLYEYQLSCLSDVSRRLDDLLPEAFRLNYATYTAK